MTARTFTADEVREMLREACEAAGGQTAWANANGLSQVTVSHTIIGYRMPGPIIADALGLEKIAAYRKKAVDRNAKVN
jgi:hypothetical protein